MLSLKEKSPGLREAHDMELELREKFTRVKDMSLKIVEVLDEEEADKEIADSAKLQQRYKEALHTLVSYQDNLSNNNDSSVNNVNRSFIQLEKVKMPIFHGDIREYPKFKSDFSKYIMPSIKQHDTAPYILNSCLEGEPQQVVKNVDGNIEDMWRRLDEIYGDISKVIDIIINEIKRLRPIPENDHRKFIELVNIVEKGYRDLERLGIPGEMSNAQTVSLIEEKLPRDMLLLWSGVVKEDNSCVPNTDKFPHLLKFLLAKKRVIEYASAELRSGSSSRGSSHHVEGQPVDQNADNRVHCFLHASVSHNTEKCRTYLSKTPQERVKFLTENKLCYSCLKPYHRLKYCQSQFICNIDGCKEPHHPTIHESHQEGQILHASEIYQDINKPCLLQIMTVNVATPKSASINILWDSGASLCLLTFNKAKAMNLSGKPTYISLVKVGGETDYVPSFVYQVPLKDKQGRIHTIQAFGIETISSEINGIDVQGILHLFKGVQSSEVERPKGYIDLLIGFNYAALHPTKEQSVGNLLLMRNIFGRCLGGTHTSLKESTISHLDTASIHHVKGISMTAHDFFEAESMGIRCNPRCRGCKCGQCSPGTNNYSLKEERELQLIEENLCFKGDYWEAKYPWIQDPDLLPDNRIAAEAMLRSTEKRLLKDPLHAKTYMSQIEEMKTRGVAVKLSKPEMNFYNGSIHYLGHHEVLKDDSKSTPCRIVFNPSASYKGVALNDFWAKGPDLLNNQLGVLLRFRQYSCAVAGDIKKMYNSIKLAPGLEQHTHRFLWRDLDIQRKPDTYLLTSVTFGDRPAGAIANVALRKTAEMDKEKFPHAAQMVIDNSYVVDLLDGFKQQRKPCWSQQMLRRLSNLVVLK